MIKVSCFGERKNAWKEDLICKTKRLIPLEWQDIPLKRLPSERPPRLLPEEEKFLKKNNSFHLMDPSGKVLSDQDFYEFCLSGPSRHLVVGPAFGFHPNFYQKALGKISLSPLTLTHELAQLVLSESLYRAACRQINHPFVK